MTTVAVGLCVQARYTYRYFPTGEGQWFRGVVHAVSPDIIPGEEVVTIRLNPGQEFDWLIGRLRQEVEVRPDVGNVSD